MYGFIIRVLLYIAPMYFANSCAMVLGSGRTPIDFGFKLGDGMPLFGAGKTIRGFVAGVAAGTLAAMLIAVLFPSAVLMLVKGPFEYAGLGFLASLGAMLGDLVKSFFKRRAGIAQGKDLLVVDQLDFIAGGIVLALPYYVPTLLEVAVIAIGTMIVHRASNLLAFKFRLKKVPW